MKNKKRTAQYAFFNLRALVGLFVCVAAVSSMLTGALLAFFRPEPPANVSQRTLTFAESVSYQRAIEDVYWRHRIWPKENSGPRPPLDAVMSQAQLEKKVEDYLRNSQALENYWQLPITAEQLQAEMERMARDSKQPEVLRELFDALGNDPFIIAECLARPVLTERLVADLSTQDKTGRFESAGTKALRSISVVAALGNVAYTLPKISDPCTNDSWTATSITNPPDAREGHIAVWTGSEMIVWGGSVYNNGYHYFNTGGRYNPATDSWTATSTTGAPSAREYHRAVWTGSEMIVWGGDAFPTNFNTGGRYNPTTDSWTATSTTGAPAARKYHTAVWTGSEMIVWGGTGQTDFNTGSRYNPNTDSWTATSITNAPAGRYHHTAVWTGTEMIVWGGDSYGGDFSNGGRYNPSTDSWTATTNVQAPADRFSHTAVWTGSEMIVWGGLGCDYGGGGSCIRNSGGRYNPGKDNWTATNYTMNVPSERSAHTAVWTDSEMIIWGGGSPGAVFNTGGRYNPNTDSWTFTSTSNAPSARGAHTAVWTGTEMIVWGGYGTSYFNTGGRYCAQFTAPSPTPTGTPTCDPNFHILIVYADHPFQPTTLRTSLLAQPGVSTVDLFEGLNGTPRPAQLQAYQIVVPYLNFAFADATAMGNVLADYIDGGGVVVGHTYLWGQYFPIQGRYATGGYNPFVIPDSNNANARNLRSCTFAPLCTGVSALNAGYTNDATLSPGAVLAATWNNGGPLIAYQTVGGHTSVGVTAYVGDNPPGTWSGDFAKVIVNAGRWLLPPCGTPTPTPTATATSTPAPRPTPTPRPSPAPRPRPTPAQRSTETSIDTL